MQIFATFQYSLFLEIAMTELKQKGITDIYAIPLDLRKEEPRLMDGLHRSDGATLLDKGFILAFVFATVGASKGFVWKWGPVVWGLIGAATGILLGVLINVVVYYIRNSKQRQQKNTGKTGEVIIIVTCEEHQLREAEQILWDHFALGVARTKEA
ncbi:hypothetical protein [Paenibacillus sp.]|uniref:hypothetical protein n=1 Tax=Paenibacillus sp. TaxID=58172 RepID=UPI002811861A|nr:hypothetical protein [Paenibacillus sp.]